MTRAQIVAELRRAARLGWQWERLSNYAYYAAAGLTHWTEDRSKADDTTNRVFFLLVACALEGE